MSYEQNFAPLEASRNSGNKTDCPVCGFSNDSIKQLKTHLLLKHSDLNLCLFCVEKKGWSDTFASNASYNEHYWSVHQGRIQKKEQKLSENREKRKIEIQAWKEEKKKALSEGLKPPKRPVAKLICFLCPKLPEFETGTDFDRHFLIQHDFDYCKLCHQMGPLPAVRLHILQSHISQLCYICCGSSPQFSSLTALDFHLSNKHGLSTKQVNENSEEFKVVEFPCRDCDVKTKFLNSDHLTNHLREVHCGSENLRAMMSNRKRKEEQNLGNSAKESQCTPKLSRICGIKNDSGLDCFSIAVLHLLAQTELVERLTAKDHHSNCQSPSCLLAHFLEDYGTSKKRVVSSKPFVDHYKQFGIKSLPVDCGDFLRGLLSTVCIDPPEHATELEDLTTKFKVVLEWKFLCPQCNRCSVMTLSDFVLRIDGSLEASLEVLLNKFLHQKRCTCGNVCQVYPGVKSVGKYIFIEIDRSVSPEIDDDGPETEIKDISIYSLELNSSYNIFGFSYALVGTVNYKLDSDEGGHYTTFFFPSKNELIKVHETEIKRSKRLPDFDVDTVIVALQKIEMTARDLKRIEIEIEYETVTDPSPTDESLNQHVATIEEKNEIVAENSAGKFGT